MFAGRALPLARAGYALRSVVDGFGAAMIAFGLAAGFVISLVALSVSVSVQ